MMRAAEREFRENLRLPRLTIVKNQGEGTFSVVRGETDPENGMIAPVTTIGIDRE